MVFFYCSSLAFESIDIPQLNADQAWCHAGEDARGPKRRYTASPYGERTFYQIN